MYKYDETLKLGIIQTTVDLTTAWNYSGNPKHKMNPYAEKSVMEEIRYAFKGFYELSESAPRIVILPEYSIPHSGVKAIEKYAKAIDAVVIGGCDLFVNAKNQAQNKGIIVIPNKWPKPESAYSTTKFYFGKKYFSVLELKFFDKLHVEAKPEALTYIIDAGKYGNIGVAICADFYDIERFLIYKGKIHHLIIIAYNKDTKSFNFLTEAISRLLLCNVVICNTGHYGDSLVFSPYDKEWKRTIYKSSGSKIFTSQVLELPVRALNEEQEKAHDMYQRDIFPSSKDNIFKWPPGYAKFKCK